MPFTGFARNANNIKSNSLALIVVKSSIFNDSSNLPSASVGGSVTNPTKAEYYLLGYTEQDSLQSTLEVGDVFSTSGGPKKVENYNASIEGTAIGTLDLAALEEIASYTWAILAVDTEQLEALTGYVNTTVSLSNLSGGTLVAHWVIDKVGFTGGYNVADGKADRIPLKFEREKISSYTDGIFQTVTYNL